MADSGIVLPTDDDTGLVMNESGLLLPAEDEFSGEALTNKSWDVRNLSLLFHSRVLVGSRLALCICSALLLRLGLTFGSCSSLGRLP